MIVFAYHQSDRLVTLFLVMIVFSSFLIDSSLCLIIIVFLTLLLSDDRLCLVMIVFT